MLQLTDIIESNGIKAWAAEDQPREKLKSHGRRHLTDTELLAILIGSGAKEETAVALSIRILKAYGNDLNCLGKATVKELSKFRGIGQVKAIAIVAAFELGRRRNRLPEKEFTKLSTPFESYAYLLPYFADLNHEEFWIVLLNRANFILSKHLISKGGQSATVVDPKVIFKIALENNASSIILAHNHPSGQTTPSDQDIRLTSKLINAGKLLDLFIIDHLIVTDHSYYSFADNGKMH